MALTVSLKKPRVSNIICTADLSQEVPIGKFVNFPWGIYDQNCYGGRCGYIKPSGMNGKVTIFRTGKMISLGAKSISDAQKQLIWAKSLLVQANLIGDVKLTPSVRNIVASLDVEHSLDPIKICKNIAGCLYEPEIFSGIILRYLGSITYLIFASGKIIIPGAKSIEELNTASFEIQQKLAPFFETM